MTSYLVLHEHLGRRSLLGAALILAGIACTELLSAVAPVPIHPD
jgi:drug/metabolite transporter (DMT)-like permease